MAFCYSKSLTAVRYRVLFLNLVKEKNGQLHIFLEGKVGGKIPNEEKIYVGPQKQPLKTYLLHM